jgi:hypothetical protein
MLRLDGSVSGHGARHDTCPAGVTTTRLDANPGLPTAPRRARVSGRLVRWVMLIVPWYEVAAW